MVLQLVAITQHQDVIYFTDKPIEEEGYIIYFVGTVNYGASPYANIHFLKNILGEFDFVGYTSSNSYYGGREWYMLTVVIDDNIISKYVIKIGGNSVYLYMIAWDNAVTSSTVRKIVKSFEYESMSVNG